MHQAQTTTFHLKRFKERKTCKSCLESSVSKRFKAKWFKVVRMLAHIIMRRWICGRPHGGAGGDCSEAVESERLRHHFPSLCQEIQSQGFQCKLTQCDVLMLKKRWQGMHTQKYLWPYRIIRYFFLKQPSCARAWHQHATFARQVQEHPALVLMSTQCRNMDGSISNKDSHVFAGEQALGLKTSTPSQLCWKQTGNSWNWIGWRQRSQGPPQWLLVTTI